MSTTKTNNDKPDTPILVRMFHPTSGRENYNDVRNSVLPPTQPTMDPQIAAQIRRQTQGAIAASGGGYPYPYQNSLTPQHPYQNFPTPQYPYQSLPFSQYSYPNFSWPPYSPYMYGIYQPYSSYQRK